MFRPTGFADLADKRVGIFGYGVEGRASERRVRALARSLVLVDDEPPGPGVLATSPEGHEQLLTCDVVLKSPGIPRRRADVLELEQHGVTVTSALNLWLHEIDRARVVAITGTKGKSTTTALVTFFLQCVGEQAQRLGNIGQPPYDPSVDTSRGWLVLEVSSFQCTDIDVAPGLVVVTSLGADHLDWHGSLARYRSDKLSLTRASGEHVTMVPEHLIFREMREQLGGEVEFVTPDGFGLTTPLGLLGAHSDSNVALALHVVARLTSTSLEHVRARVEAHAHEFIPLRGRLTLVANVASGRGTVRYVDDGLATSVLPTLAALEVFRDDPVALLA
ncbi:MAG: Mur ligase family protein, partial [Acidimicrobiales bacterium]